MESTNFSRKLDQTGRIVIPKRLLEQMGMVAGQEYNFFIHEDESGRNFICIECPGINQEVLEQARKLVQKYGI